MTTSNRAERRRFERHPVKVPFQTPVGDFITTAHDALQAADQWDAGDHVGALHRVMGEFVATAYLATSPPTDKQHALLIDLGARAAAATRDYLDARGMR